MHSTQSNTLLLNSWNNSPRNIFKFDEKSISINTLRIHLGSTKSRSTYSIVDTEWTLRIEFDFNRFYAERIVSIEKSTISWWKFSCIYRKFKWLDSWTSKSIRKKNDEIDLFIWYFQLKILAQLVLGADQRLTPTIIENAGQILCVIDEQLLRRIPHDQIK